MLKKLKKLLPMRSLIVYLLILVVMTTSVTFSSYLTSATGGDSARVARYSVDIISGNDVTIDGKKIDAETSSANYVFTVQNHSEVAVSYTLTLKTKKTLPEGFTLTIGETSHSTDAATTVFEFPGGSIGPNASQEVTLTVTATLDAFTTDFTAENLQITVDARQIN